ncbi:Uncharacterized protein OBRU01_15738 [Operophtera brumata]|uniref:Uncharacterized protein n=1 Tax=Operophtera brumata TaxID=104452 RepID=A0A0L7KZ70_OPEBR|nr:Uncharacterized protein OBRU01_15738 [Operophtera brumata]
MLKNRDGYPVWKFKTKMLLLHEELWSSISGYESSDKTSLEHRLRKNQKALSKISLTVDGSAISYVRTAKTATEAWYALQKHMKTQDLDDIGKKIDDCSLAAIILGGRWLDI